MNLEDGIGSREISASNNIDRGLIVFFSGDDDLMMGREGDA